MQASLSVDIIWPIPHVKHCSGGFVEEPQCGIEVAAVDGVVGGEVDSSAVYNTQYSTYDAVYGVWFYVFSLRF